MRVYIYTRGGWAHRKHVSTTFLTRNNSHKLFFCCYGPPQPERTQYRGTFNSSFWRVPPGLGPLRTDTNEAKHQSQSHRTHFPPFHATCEATVSLSQQRFAFSGPSIERTGQQRPLQGKQTRAARAPSRHPFVTSSGKRVRKCQFGHSRVIDTNIKCSQGAVI